MFKTVVSTALATFASADINAEFSCLLHGECEWTQDQIEPLWNAFVEEYEELSPVDLNTSEAFVNFFVKVDKIIEHNSNPESTYEKGINMYSAMTFEQLSEHFNFEANQANAEQNCSATRSSPLTAAGADSAPDSYDWRNHGGVSPVKDQGSCGSCWTFSTVGCLESAHLIKYGTLATYAEQQLVDCAGDFDNFGCNGGLPSHAFEYINYNGGIASEEAYPYYAVDRTCTVQSSDYILSVGHAMNITEGDENELKQAVYQQPVSVAFQVVDGFSDYTSGVYTSDTCLNGTSDVNHAVLAVGYGTDADSGMDYWIVKNSWSAEWGDEGFFLIERGVNMCGIAECNSYPASVDEISNGLLQ